MPRLHSFLHHHTSWQPWGLVEVQPVQELLPNHLHRLSETLLVKTRVRVRMWEICIRLWRQKYSFWQLSVILVKKLIETMYESHMCVTEGAAVSPNFKRRWKRWKCLEFFNYRKEFESSAGQSTIIIVCQTFFNINLSHTLISLCSSAWQCGLVGKLKESAETRITIMWTEMWNKHTGLLLHWDSAKQQIKKTVSLVNIYAHPGCFFPAGLFFNIGIFTLCLFWVSVAQINVLHPSCFAHF